MDRVGLTVPQVADAFSDVETTVRGLNGQLGAIPSVRGLQAAADDMRRFGVSADDATGSMQAMQIAAEKGHPLEAFTQLVERSADAAELWARQNGLGSDSLVQLLIATKRAGGDDTLLEKIAVEGQKTAEFAGHARVLAATLADVGTATDNTARVLNNYDPLLNRLKISHGLVVAAINNETGARALLDRRLADGGQLTGDLTGAISDLYVMQENGTAASKSWHLALGDVEGAMTNVGDATSTTSGKVGSYGGTVRAAIGANVGFGDSAQVTADKLTAEGQAVDNLMGHIFGLRDAQSSAATTQLDYADALDDVAAKQKAYNDAVTASGANSTAAKAAYRDWQRAVIGVGDAVSHSTQAERDLALQTAGFDSIADATAKGGLQSVIHQLQVQATHLAPGSPLRKDLDAYIRKLRDEIPKNVHTNLDLDTSKADSKIGQWLRQHNGSTIRINVDGTVTIRDQNGKVVGSHAGGGDVMAGDVSWVGEKGPELVRFGRDAHVYPHEQSMRMVGTTHTSAPVDQSTLVAELRALRRDLANAAPGVHIANVNGNIDEIARAIRDEQSWERTKRSLAVGVPT